MLEICLCFRKKIWVKKIIVLKGNHEVWFEEFFLKMKIYGWRKMEISLPLVYFDGESYFYIDGSAGKINKYYVWLLMK